MKASSTLKLPGQITFFLPPIFLICSLIYTKYNKIPFVTCRGKLRRIIGQFGPYVWVDYDWKPLSSLGRWFSMLGIIAIVSREIFAFM